MRALTIRPAVSPALALFAALALTTSLVVATEEPGYQVIETFSAQEGDFEVRQYLPYLVAEVEVDSSFNQASNRAFNALFQYISGRNAGREKIEMTAPVNQLPAVEDTMSPNPGAGMVQRTDEDGGYVVQFVMPERFTLDNIPDPMDSRVRIRRVPARTMAVMSYSGSWSESHYREHETKLMSALVERGIERLGTAVFARYDSPMIPSQRRRNEVMVEIDWKRAVSD